ncbi:MAG: ATP phosphoribosyltransferase regulatory subunit, partial [Pseudomonadota bacterium]
MNDFTQNILAHFEQANATRVDADILQPAKILLDLYGEAMRARAYITQDPLRGELMLRPDFTVPVVQRHMADRAEPARYCYAGPVFRQPDFNGNRQSEHIQVGYEVLDDGNPAILEAEVFALFLKATHPAAVNAIVGDVGLLIAAIDALATTDARKTALKRHIWRPQRFQNLLDRFGGPIDVPEPAPGGPQIGLRTAADVAARHAQRTRDAGSPPIAGADIAAIKALLAITAPFADVPQALAPIT